MPFMTWTDKFSVGVSVFDDDHKTLVARMNNLFDGISAEQGHVAVGKALDGLAAYAAAHFQREEKLLAETGYPDLAAHKQEHAELFKDVGDLLEQYKSNPMSTSLPLEVLAALKSALDIHICKCDKMYTAHLNSKGIK